MSIHPVFMFLRALCGLSHKNSVMNGSEKQETTGYTDTQMSTYTADRHMHAWAEVVFVYVSG